MATWYSNTSAAPSYGAYRIRLVVTETDTDAGDNESTVSWELRLEMTSGSPGFWGYGGRSWRVQFDGSTIASASGTIPNSSWGTVLVLGSGTRTVGHNSDGSKTLQVSAYFHGTATSYAPGDMDISTKNLGLTTLKVKPNVPSGVSAARIDDSQIELSWANSGASNGQATQNIIQRRVNGGAWDSGTTITATTTATVSANPNEKLEFRIAAKNTAGTSSYSSATAPVYTTPGTPSSVAAAKNPSQDIVITFSENVAYSEYEHEVWHGTVTGGVTTWDGSPLATLPAGTLTYTHVSPNAAQIHVYRVRAKAGTLYSSYVESNSVQLLVAPNAPTVAALAAYADKDAALTVAWVHNTVDTSPQSAYEFGYSTNGGSSWSTTGKVVSTTEQYVIPASTYAANDTLTIRVRTWGQATTGGSDGTGASPWSDLKNVTFKTAPVATITSPADSSTVNEAELHVSLGFAQAEGATFVKAQLRLIEDAATLEELETVTLLGTAFETPVLNGHDYTVEARVQGSNGIWSGWASNDFDVAYLAPVTPVVTLSYLEETGFGQIDITLPAPGAGESEAALVTITRRIDGGAEQTIVKDYPAADALAFLDTTPTIHGTNTYAVKISSELGARTTVTSDLVTDECRRAFLSKGASYSTVAVFGANLSVNESLGVASDTVSAAGRSKPIGLYGVETAVVLKVSSFVYETHGSTVDEWRTILLLPGKACFRDASGRRVFGSVKGGLSYNRARRADISFTISETS